MSSECQKGVRKNSSEVAPRRNRVPLALKLLGVSQVVQLTPFQLFQLVEQQQVEVDHTLVVCFLEEHLPVEVGWLSAEPGTTVQDWPLLTIAVHWI